MAAAALTYAKAGGPPDDWKLLLIYDHDRACWRTDVFEINTAEGWVQVYFHDEAGRLVCNGDVLATDRIIGNFEIIRRPARYDA